MISAGGSQWDEFLHTYMDKWKMRIKNWVMDSINDHPVHVVRYESQEKHNLWSSQNANILECPF